MKKILSVIIMCLLITTFLVACKQESTASIVAKDLDKNLNKLSVTVNKMDTIDNNYIANPDIYSSISTPSPSYRNKKFALTFNETTNNTNDIVKQLLVNRIKENLLNQNNQSNENTFKCQKYCDSNGSCYYTDCNGNNYSCSGNSCTPCDTIPSQCSYVGEVDLSTCTNAMIENQSFDDLQTERLSIENQINEDNANISQDTENENASTNNTPDYRVYYYTQESFSPFNLRYMPRYVTSYNEDNINNQIEAYMIKIQKLYAMTEDSIEANNVLAQCKGGIIDCIEEIKELNRNIIDGECEPTVQQLEAIKNYIDDLKTTISRLNNCNGELSKEVDSINNSNSSSIINSVDIINSRYIKLLNHIDTRITYHKSAMATLDQLKYLLEDTVNGTSVSEEEILDIVENSDMQENEKNNIVNIINEIQSTENKEEQVADSNNVFSDTNYEQNDINMVDNDSNNILTDNNNNYFDNNESVKIDENANNYPNENEIINNNNTSDNDEDLINVDSENNVDIVENTASEYDNNQDNSNLDDEENNTTEDTENNESEYEENNNINKETGQVEEENTSTNIDSYQNNSLSNIDTYREENVDSQTTDNNENNINYNNDIDDNFNNAVTKNNNDIDTTNSENFNENYNHSNEVSTLEWTDDMALNNYQNNENFTNENSIGDENNGLVNENLYQNSVITQNNLDTNNGGTGYYYTNDGEIRNIGTDNNDNLGNNGNTVETNMNRNNNVNTYGYNTILDIINQGTVNNGINTL